MRIKQKKTLGSTLLVLVPAAIISITLGMETIEHSSEAMEKQVQNKAAHLIHNASPADDTPDN